MKGGFRQDWWRVGEVAVVLGGETGGATRVLLGDNESRVVGYDDHAVRKRESIRDDAGSPVGSDDGDAPKARTRRRGKSNPRLFTWMSRGHQRRRHSTRSATGHQHRVLDERTIRFAPQDHAFFPGMSRTVPALSCKLLRCPARGSLEQGAHSNRRIHEGGARLTPRDSSDETTEELLPRPSQSLRSMAGDGGFRSPGRQSPPPIGPRSSRAAGRTISTLCEHRSRERVRRDHVIGGHSPCDAERLAT
jgi:hypothetical protein